MWPLWLIIAVAVGGALAVTTSAVFTVIHVERQRHRKIIAENGIDRNLSQYQRPHLSIIDVDFANIPRPGRSLRQSLQTPRRDSRFYSIMLSEDEIRTFPEGTAESLASTTFIHTDANRSHQWLNPGKSKKLEKRKKKSIQLSISAPMARSPMSAITEQTESVRQGSPEPVELPAQTTPRITPSKFVATDEPLPTAYHLMLHGSIDSIVDQAKKNQNRISTRINNGNAVKSRSISLGSIAPPPNCPLPPVPGDRPVMQARQPTLSRSVSEHSTIYRDILLLNSPMTSPPVMKSTIITVQPSGKYSGFNFGSNHDEVQVVQVENHETSIRHEPESDKIPVLSSSSEVCHSVPRSGVDTTSKAIVTHEWNLPVGLRHLGPNRVHTSAERLHCDSRPSSIVSSPSTDGPLSSHRPSPVKMQIENTFRPVSISGVDFFRKSVIGVNMPILPPSSPRTRGHKRQNCIRISGLTPVDHAKKRLSSQLDRLAEAEETEAEDALNTSDEPTTISSPRNKHTDRSLSITPSKNNTLNISKIRQPQALSLRVRRPGLLDRDGPVASPTKSESSRNTVSPLIRPSNPIICSQRVDPGFVYAGSPSFDPTRSLPLQQEYSPVSPSAGPDKKPTLDDSEAENTGVQHANEAQTFDSPASTSILFSIVSSTVAVPSTGSAKRQNTTQLHGPRIAPPPSLRTRNGTHIPPHLRQSPMRKTSQSKTSATTSRRNSTSIQDELHRKTALLRSLSHAATVGKAGGLPEINIIKSNLAPFSDVQSSRTPSSHYVDSPQVTTISSTEVKPALHQSRGPRQRSKTVATSTLIPPKPRQESTYPIGQSLFSSSPSNISIWEDASLRGDSDNESPSPSRRSQNIEKLMHRHSQTTMPAMSATAAAVEKASLWKLQQNADIITSRALAFNNNRDSKTTSSSGKSPKHNGGERKISKLDGFWGDKSEQKSLVGAPVRTRATNNIMGPRQRAHTVCAAPPKVRYTQLSSLKTEQGIGLGLDFGQGAPAGTSSVRNRRKDGNSGPVFMNDMERDGIGQLR